MPHTKYTISIADIEQETLLVLSNCFLKAKNYITVSQYKSAF